MIRTQGGAGKGYAAQHSQSLEAWFCYVPGLIVVMPATPRDARGLLKSAIREPNPVLFIEHKVLYNSEGEVPDAEELIPLGKAEIKRAGHGRDHHGPLAAGPAARCEAAETLAKDHGIDAEVLDLRTVNPLDEESDPRLRAEDGAAGDRGGRATRATAWARRSWRGLSARPSTRWTPSRAGSRFPNCPVPFAKSLEIAAAAGRRRRSSRRS